MRETGPYLLAVDHPLVAALLGAGGQGRKVAAGAGFGESLAPGFATGQQQGHHLGGEFGSGVVDQRRRQHFEHRVRSWLIESAADDLLADHGPKDHGSAQPACGFGPAPAHPARVVQRAEHPRMLRVVRVQRVIIGRWCQVVLVEPRTQVRPELGDVHADGRPIACGLPWSWSPLRRMNVMALVFSRQPSTVRTYVSR